MAHGGVRDERKERQWRRRVGEWRARGLGVWAFCARRDLAAPSFYKRVALRAAELAIRLPVR
jgi:hypothetical protein